jgi:hypothetical protein
MAIVVPANSIPVNAWTKEYFDNNIFYPGFKITLSELNLGDSPQVYTDLYEIFLKAAAEYFADKFDESEILDQEYGTISFTAQIPIVVEPEEEV